MHKPLVAALAVCASLTVPVASALAAPNNNNSQKLRKAVDVPGILEHMTAFQAHRRQ